MNVEPHTTVHRPKAIKRLNGAATEWLRHHDPKYKINRLRTNQARQKAAKQAEENPQLVREYRRLMLRGRY